ncbi:D-lactate ferricytochrome c oxidoreductase [Orbilia ellipsospora]|uniref:D-lactate dehydrogenase (cytochrome) n=1 Tax=Orbilia ellipsospora TaxID=2528407 RepID=A0AAV9XBT9_9PEZI
MRPTVSPSLHRAVRAPLRRKPCTAISSVAAIQGRSRFPQNQIREQSNRPLQQFHGQMWEATSKRIQTERAEMEKYWKERQERKNREGDGYFSNTLPQMFAWVLSAVCAYWLGANSWAPAKPFSTTKLEDAPEVYHDVSKHNLSAAWSQFAILLGDDNVSCNEHDLDIHSGNSWSSHPPKSYEKPFMVLYPSTTEQVSEIAKICHHRKIPITGYSGGTSLEGHINPTRSGVCIDFSRMDKVVKLNKDDLDVVVQPGVGWEHLNEMLEEHNLFFPPDPGPGAMIGGMVGTGCSGTNAARYGTMREWVLSLTVVLADGTVIKTRQRPRKSSAGYDMTRIFIGSEGTLGLVTEATLKLAVKPQNESVAVCSFPSIRDAASAASKIIEQGIPVAAVEILDDVQMMCLNRSGTTSRSWKERPTLFFKFSGTKLGVKEQISLVQSIAKSCKSESFEFATSEEERHELWSARKNALWSVIALKEKPDDQVWTTDVAVPISKLPDIIEATKNDMMKNKVLGSIVGHVGDGNFHCILLFGQQDRRKAEGVVHRMVETAISLEGTTTGEHGVGLLKRDYLPKELGQGTVDAMRKMKLAFDPLCILNCDKVIRMESPKLERDRWSRNEPAKHNPVKREE